MRKEEKTELTKEKIMKAAMEEFGLNGYAGASLNSICHTGISKGLLYHNFENKDSLYLACVNRCISLLTDYIRSQNIGSDLHRYMDVRLQFFKSNPDMAKIFFEVIIKPPVHLNQQIKELQKSFDELNRTIYQEILSSVSLRTGVTSKDAMEYFIMMQYMFNGYFSSTIYPNMSFSDVVTAHEESLTKYLDFMLYGIAERSNEAL